MKLRKKLVAVLAASMVVTSVPVVTMADTTNYVSTARYAKEGTTYGYTEGLKSVEGILVDAAVGTNGTDTKYTSFNGFEFSPIMNYTQPGTMFMSLTEDTEFNALAILTYADSFYASTGNTAVESDLYAGPNNIIGGAKIEELNGKTVEEAIKDGVTLKLDAQGKPVRNSLDKQALVDKLAKEIETNSNKYLKSMSHIEVANKIVETVVKEVEAALEAGKSVASIKQDVNAIITEAVKDFENVEVTTGSAVSKEVGTTLNQGEVTKFLLGAVQDQLDEMVEVATITIRQVKSFDVKDADDRKYDSHLRVDFKGNFNKGVTYKVPLVAKIGGDKVVLLNIDGNDSFVTKGRYNLTQDAVSDKRVTVTATSKTIRTNYTEEIGKIKITETAIDALQGDGVVNRKIKVTLPSSSDLEFNLTKTEDSLTATGMRGFYGETPEILAVEYGVEEYRNTTEKDRQTLIITLPNWTDATAKGEIELTGIFVQPVDREAAVGDVNVTISEYIAKDAVDKKSSNLVAETTVKVAEVKDYDVAITCETPAEIKAGRSGLANDKSATFILEEAVKDSLVDGRKIEFVLENGYLFGPADVTVKGEQVKDVTSAAYKEAALDTFDALVENGDIKVEVLESGKYVDKKASIQKEDIKLTFDAEGRVIGFITTYTDLKETVADKLKVTIPVATDVMSTGEVKVVAKNLYTRSYQDAQEDPSCVIAKIAAPIEVSFDGAKLKVGLQAQEAGSITIKETDKGMLEKGWLFLTADIASGITFDKVPTVTVEDASGKEVKVTNVSLNKAGTVLGLEITKTSTEAATIKVSDIVLTADRTVPEANYDLVIWGSALTDENELSIADFNLNNRYLDQASDIYTVKEFVQMTTKNTEDITENSSTTTTTSFVIGESTFTVNGEEVKMDTAPYIKDNYTFVPVKYVAQAFGIAGNAVQYDKATSTATIIAGNKVINITHGKSYIVVNGTQVPMAAKAEVVNGRMCVPMAYIAAALGVEKSWDATTKTATFTNEVK